MGKRKNKPKRSHSKSGKNRTPIAQHTRKKGELLPPFAAMGGKMAFSYWMNDRLPEMLWAVLIRSAVNQDYALGMFRRLLNFIAEHEAKDSLSDITLTGLAKVDKTVLREVVAFIIEPPEAAQALSCLRLFQALPARDVWDDLLPDIPPDIDLLMQAVGSTLWHQSQEATDCRWLRMMPLVMTGKMHMPGEMLKEWLGYPNVSDQRKVRPSIRAAEIAHTSMEPLDLTWPRAFWDEAWKNTPCLALKKTQSSGSVAPEGVTIQRLHEVRNLLADHWERSYATTAIDAKHDTVFGVSFYALRLLEELMGIGVGNGIVGRLGIRTLFEVHVNLRYLLSKNDPELWKTWRSYGAGQAKLNALKFDDDLDPPTYINVNSIEQIAGEDIWEEFLNIHLASWSGVDLRKLSERVNLKAAYDTHYSWTSGYAHGNWGAVRESCFQTCGNPLHRLHRYPEQRHMEDVVDEATMIVDAILDDLAAAYSPFQHRLKQRQGTSKQGASPDRYSARAP